MVEPRLKAEASARARRPFGYRKSAAKFYAHRDLADFDFEVLPVDPKLVTELVICEFKIGAHNALPMHHPARC